MTERDRAAAMREEFDLAFAGAPEPELELLLIRAGGEPYAILQSDVASIHALVHAQITIVPLPSANPALLGVANVRRQVVPVYDLRVALDIIGGGTPRWMIVVGGTTSALAFDRLDGTARIRSRVQSPAPLLDPRHLLSLLTKET